MSFDLGNLLQGQLGNVLGQFLTNNGESEDNSAKAAGLALPAIVAGLVKHVSGGATNASGLIDLLTGSAGSQLTKAVSQATAGGNGLATVIELGKNLLPNLLGGNAANVADQIAQESGVSKASAGSLLSLALPLVLSVLRGKAQSDNLGAGQLLGLLGQQQGWLSKVLNSNMLSALGIGSLSGLFGGLTNLISSFGGTAAGTAAAAAGATAATAAAAKKGGIGKWIALIVVALAALLALKNCGKGEEAAPAPAEAAASAASEASAPVEAPAASEASVPAVASEVAPAASAPAASEAAPIADAGSEAARVVVENGVAKFFFATGKNDIAQGAEAIVADIISAGKDGKKLVVSGFADSTGDAAANEKLSKDRAEAVKAFFEAQGVDAANIELRKPESTTGAVGNDLEGRRVEVKIEG
ncbi:OmpA family protein [Neisseria perflava]|uniref:OmpA family protein n=1 Tax=Neisseria perflava TaxID=33053 RepID=UPI00209DF1BC|nr:OmpA family protein [Neisseria perflava]